MTLPPGVEPVPWDSAVFGVKAFEITIFSGETLAWAVKNPGHYTVRLDPLASKQLLHEYGFYYCDTLVEPFCKVDRFIGFDDPAVFAKKGTMLEPLLAIGHGAFAHGRFHRDFQLPRTFADQRYENWLVQLHRAGKVFGLFWHEELAGFIAVDGNRLVLHAVAESLRGQGLARHLWTPVCRGVFADGWDEVVSSVSAANLPVVSLYQRLGFRLRNALDLYHRMTG